MRDLLKEIILLRLRTFLVTRQPTLNLILPSLSERMSLVVRY